MQKLRRCRKHIIRATPKVCNSSGVTQSTKAIDAGVFYNSIMKTDRGNLSSEDDSYFSNAEDEEAGTVYV